MKDRDEAEAGGLVVDPEAQGAPVQLVAEMDDRPQHGEELEIRSFELGVCVQPDRPSELVEPLGSGEQAERARPPSVWAQAIPFHIERRVPCADPFVSRSLTYTECKAEMGHLNY